MEEFLDNIYDEIITQSEEVDDIGFCAVARMFFAEFEKAHNEIIDLQNNVEKGHLLTVKVSFKNIKNTYRVFMIPSHLKVSDLVYCTLASFELMTFEKYFVKYRSEIFYPSFEYDEILECEGHIDDNVFAADETVLELMQLKKGDKLFIDYGFSDWPINCEIIKSTKNKDKCEEPKLILGEGVILPYLDEEANIMLKKKQYDYFKEGCFDDSELEEYKEKINLPLDIKEIKENFIIFLNTLYEFYEETMDFDSDEKDFYDEKFEREQILNELQHIQVYEKYKAIFVDLMHELFEYFEKNQEKYINTARQFLTNKLNEFPKKIALKNIELTGQHADNYLSCYIFPLGDNYESVSEYFFNNKKIKKHEQKEMLTSIIKSKVGVYKVIEYDIDEATLVLCDIKTNERIDIVDKNLSYSLTYINKNEFCLCGRIIKYKEINFLSNGIVLYNDEDVEEFIRLIKENEYNSLDYFANAININMKQIKSME